jgi:hypothetical protein
VIADALAGEADTADALPRQHVAFGDGHQLGFAFDEFDAARGAPRIASARVKDVDPRILFNREHEPLACFYLDTGKSFNRQLWHRALIIRLEALTDPMLNF